MFCFQTSRRSHKCLVQVHTVRLYPAGYHGLNPLSFDPATNNDPLQFNGSSGPLVTECPALETSTENTKKRKRANLPPAQISMCLVELESPCLS
ncbi:hypothetical protein D4764_09G0003230 [Takifugu flavidus]|uniref:Uncharacterized protein n=1 Tax=Takifugu flavidus TaxID=433684 RepID=A0A5C6MJB6_9TELE|nr:hypothetical protein D4764_09G0003230 [Takifugu flavidus]